VRLTVLGACGAYPAAGSACSGFLVEHDGFRLLLDAGYATMPRLLSYLDAAEVDAALITHGHPDHCADLNPLLRARALTDVPPPALPVYAPRGALDAVLALDRPQMLDGSYDVRAVVSGEGFTVGPFTVDALALPHFVPNLGYRLTAGGATLAYTGDTGPSPEIARLARGADVLLAEATYVDAVVDTDARFLSSARQAGAHAAAAAAGRLLLTHLWPGTDEEAAVAGAMASFRGPTEAATSGLVITFPLP
jgi:ribonuclease BN (tRNA processing enzyme)